MKTGTYIAFIGGYAYDVNNEKTHLYYGGDWTEIKVDGNTKNKYITFRYKRRWLDDDIHINN